ncbi:MAG: hypothetical protein M5R36_11290 [Deltaproteobacteria bacterium]|nr:hypothetical protein [Deltaproteobacteria bacterium]
MQQLPHYFISAARFDGDAGRLRKVRAHKVFSGKAASDQEIDRDRLLRMIRAGYLFMTVRRDDAGNVDMRAPVRAVEVEGRPFVRGDTLAAEGDDLGELPAF